MLQRAKLMELLASGEPMSLIGAYDALSALLVEKQGCPVVYMGGFATVASAFGQPDVGIVSRTEMLGAYERAANVLTVPLVVDLDAGYGSLGSVRSAVSALRRLGVAGFHIEDQVEPKRCGHLDNKRVVSLIEGVSRVRAAVCAAGDDGPLVIARTDALASEGLDSAITRINAYRRVGAHVGFVDAIRSVDEMTAIRNSVDGPLVFNAATTERSVALSVAEAHELGFSIVLHPIELLRAATSAIAQQTQILVASGRSNPPTWPSFDDLNSIVGLHRHSDWETAMSAEPGSTFPAEKEYSNE